MVVRDVLSNPIIPSKNGIIILKGKGLREINRIQRIKIENVKGKDLFELRFNELYAYCPNLFVAPNGFGKSTIATTFKALKPNKIELEKEDYYQGNDTNLPSLELEVTLDEVGNRTIVADTSKNEISSLIDTYVINNPLYAKSTSRSFGNFSSKSARLDVENLVFYDRVPKKVEIPYRLNDIKRKYGEKGKVFSNIANIFKSLKNLGLLSDNYILLNKCASQKRSVTAVANFFEQLSGSGSAKAIKQSITSENLGLLKNNPNIFDLLQIVKEFEYLPFEEENEVDLILTAIQIIEVTKQVGNDIKKAKSYLEYEIFRSELDQRLEMFNTTGRTIKTKVTKNKLELEFLAAKKMSNGERDVLSFISSLSKFMLSFTKSIGILIIDEIFDYLDGSNMLIAQYYLQKMIEESKAKDKVLFPIILTHLDPILFNNYYFNKLKIHYLKSYPYIADRTMIKFLKIRSNKDIYGELSTKIERFCLHYHNVSFQFTEAEKTLIDKVDYQNSELFYKMIHNETEKYLDDKKYDPLKVICAIRVKIEKIVYDWLNTPEQKNQFIEEHGTIKKLNYACEQGINVPEDFYLLQPLFNDALHLTNNENATRNKIQSICLKLDNIVVQEIVRNIQATIESNLVVLTT